MGTAEFIYTVLLKPRPLRRLANTALRAITPARLQIHGVTVVLNRQDPVVSGALTLGVYEKPETAFFRSVCRPGMSFLDIGANVGYYTALALGAHCRVLALEPDPECFSYLEKTAEANGGGAELVNAAAGAEEGSATLFVSSENRGDNRLYSNELSDGSLTVRAVTIDALRRERGFPAPDLIKMDVQGYEGQVIAGMEETLRSSLKVVLLSEFWPYGLTAAGSKPEQVLALLESWGLELHELTPRGGVTKLGDHAEFVARYPGRKYTNVVAARAGVLPAELFEDA